MVTAEPQTETERLRELIQHAQEGSPIAMAAVQSRLQGVVADGPPRILLALARQLLDLRDTTEGPCM